jgi:hypothetical protein
MTDVAASDANELQRSSRNTHTPRTARYHAAIALHDDEGNPVDTDKTSVPAPQTPSRNQRESVKSLPPLRVLPVGTPSAALVPSAPPKSALKKTKKRKPQAELQDVIDADFRLSDGERECIVTAADTNREAGKTRKHRRIRGEASQDIYSVFKILEEDQHKTLSPRHVCTICEYVRVSFCTFISSNNLSQGY